MPGRSSVSAGGWSGRNAPPPVILDPEKKDVPGRQRAGESFKASRELIARAESESGFPVVTTEKPLGGTLCALTNAAWNQGQDRHVIELQERLPAAMVKHHVLEVPGFRVGLPRDCPQRSPPSSTPRRAFETSLEIRSIPVPLFGVNYEILIPDETRQRAEEYQACLRSGTTGPGLRLQAEMERAAGASDFLTVLLRTKQPQIFAESAVAGDGSDWTLTELQLLGDISVAMDVRIFDDGRHANPMVHEKPLDGSLIFVPGALLRGAGPAAPADWDEVTGDDRSLNPEAYDALCERRLLPGLRWIEKRAAASGHTAFVTIPGLGCGQFAGPFARSLGPHLERAIRRCLRCHAEELPSIRTVLFDPYGECAASRDSFGALGFLVRPLLQGGAPQLADPTNHEQPGDDFRNCRLFSFVAWDHVSWPGNDFFGGSRCTDDGVKAAATNSMEIVTGAPGNYCPQRNAYLPPAPFRTWGQLVSKRGIVFPS